MDMLEFFLFVCSVCAMGALGGLTSMTFNTTISSGSTTTIGTQTVEGESSVRANPTVAAAKTGTLTTRTTDTTGTLTMESGHGIITGQVFDLYWSGGKCHTVTAGIVSGTSVPIASVGGGDVLPAAATAVTAGIRNEAVFNVVGNNMKGLLLKTGDYAGYIILADGSSNHHVAYVTTTTPYHWNDQTGVTNPIAGDTLTKVIFSHGTTTGSSTQMEALAVIA